MVDQEARLRQLADLNILEIDGSTFGLETKISFGRIGVAATGNFVTVYPQSHFAIDRSDVIVIPNG